jgi:CDP-diacylglycerol--glycerol-3-phosphate 3-phosphatidyltransferase
MNPIAVIRGYIRKGIEQLAVTLNTVTAGRLTPDMVTWTGFLAHFIIGYAIIVGNLGAAAVLLVIFGLFDTLDGSLARLQKVDSPRGMFLDAVTDRFKEVILYTTIAWYLLDKSEAGLVLAVLACGIALSISYVKAKGEAAIAATKGGTHQAINKMFHDGLAAFEIRITILIFGLLFAQLPLALGIIVLLGGLTLTQRFLHVYRAL